MAFDRIAVELQDRNREGSSFSRTRSGLAQNVCAFQRDGNNACLDGARVVVLSRRQRFHHHVRKIDIVETILGWIGGRGIVGGDVFSSHSACVFWSSNQAGGAPETLFTE